MAVLLCLAPQLGERYFLSSSTGNDLSKSHVPNVRVAFRYETYHDECAYLQRCLGRKLSYRGMLTRAEEKRIVTEVRMSQQVDARWPKVSRTFVERQQCKAREENRQHS